MLSVAGETQRDSYVFDVVNVGRQVLGNYFMTLRDRFATAYEARNREELMRMGLQMNELLFDLDCLLGAHSTFLFGRWIEGAAAFGRTPVEKEYYKKNARTLLTTWGEKGQSLNDYANRSWAGLTAGYYHQRWRVFVEDVCTAVEHGRDFDQQAFNRKMIDLEQAFTENDFASATRANENGVQIARELMKKYRERIVE